MKTTKKPSTVVLGIISLLAALGLACGGSRPSRTNPVPQPRPPINKAPLITDCKLIVNRSKPICQDRKIKPLQVPNPDLFKDLD